MHHDREWKHYNQSLINRGKINFWINKKSWRAPRVKKNGAPFIYSDEAIKVMLYLRFTFSISLRQLQGFVSSLFAMQKMNEKVPCYTQICRRMQKLSLLEHLLKKRSVTNIVLDTTGLKVYGVGEWRAKRYGGNSQWKKLHLSMDLKTGKILFAEATGPYKHDTSLLEKCLKKANRRNGTVLIDGIADIEKCYSLSKRYGKQLLTPPRSGAVIREGPQHLARNKAIRMIQGLGGDKLARSIWSKLSGYSRRALIESLISRWKRLYGGALKSRTEVRIQKEIQIKAWLINKLIDQESRQVA